MNLFAWCIFFLAAVFEVGGDAAVRAGLKSRQGIFILAGMLVLGCYGVIVNTIRWNFSKLLGVYVAVFAVVSILTGRFVFKEAIPPSTWLGLGIIVIGGLVIQFGPQ